MTSEERRILKIATVREIRFSGTDQDGDSVYVDLDRRTAQQVLEFIKNGILDQTGSKPLMLGG
jgi:hypothetical protein